MNSTPEPPVIPTPASRRFALFIRIATIGVLLVLLHIPLGMTHGILRERQEYQTQATSEIAAIWGRQQVITGPVLAVPYAYKNAVIRSRVINGRKVDVEETELTPAVAYFLPESLAVNGAIMPEVRSRGIYQTVVYTTALKFAGQFQPDFGVAGIDADQVDWDKARVLFGISDLHGVRSVGPLKLGSAAEAAFESAGAGADSFLPLAARVSGLTAGTRIDFSFDASVQGSGQLEIAPVGKTSRATLQSDWADSSFIGATLPIAKGARASGFNAEWESSHFSHGFPQSWTTRRMGNAEMTEKLTAAAFGVRFMQPVNGYSMAERAQKYAMLFFVLIFAVFFLFEITAGLRIHPLQYAMVGGALCLFFLGFLALSEFWNTGLAYAVAAALCTILVSLYSWTFLAAGGRALAVGGGLAATYGYLYFVLQSQDYALVAGTLALFAALALVMFCTRGINWYSLDLPGTSNAAATRQ